MKQSLHSFYELASVKNASKDHYLRSL